MENSRSNTEYKKCLPFEQARELDPESWRAVDEAVLCFVRDRKTGRVLLIHKKTGLGAGLINGPGGRIEPGETPREAAVRETREEVKLDVRAGELRHAGDLFFQFTDGYSIRGYVFDTWAWTGEPAETVEAAPFWCDEKAIPYEDMWKDDSWWLPHMLAGRPFRGRFIFDGQSMMSMSMDVESAPEGSEGIPRNGGV